VDRGFFLSADFTDFRRLKKGQIRIGSAFCLWLPQMPFFSVVPPILKWIGGPAEKMHDHPRSQFDVTAIPLL
jgi:hypothetical protein